MIWISAVFISMICNRINTLSNCFLKKVNSNRDTISYCGITRGLRVIKTASLLFSVCISSNLLCDVQCSSPMQWRLIPCTAVSSQVNPGSSFAKRKSTISRLAQVPCPTERSSLFPGCLGTKQRAWLLNGLMLVQLAMWICRRHKRQNSRLICDEPDSLIKIILHLKVPHSIYPHYQFICSIASSQTETLQC